MSFSPLDTLCINTIRTLSMDAIQKANSGHPGLPMGAAPMAYVLWRRHLRHAPKHPGWADRDRFVLSAGHGSMLLYSLLHLTGYDVTLEDIKNFPPMGREDAGPSGIVYHAGRRGDHRSARSGHGQRRRHGHGGARAGPSL